MLRHLFIYDVCVAAARRGYALQVFMGEVDREGYDVVLDDADRIRKVQLKSVIGKAGAWNVQKNVLRPDVLDVERLGFDVAPTSNGSGGAVVLQVIEPGEEGLSVTYEVTDIAFLVAMANGLIRKRQSAIPRQAIRRVLQEVCDGKRSEKVRIPRGAFFKVPSPSHLLAALGLASVHSPGTELEEVVAAALLLQEGSQTSTRSALLQHVKAISCDF